MRDRPRRPGEASGAAGRGGGPVHTRRTLLAAAVAAGVGVGAAGVQRGDGGADGRPAPEGDVAGTAGVDDEADRAVDPEDALAEAPVLGANLNGRPHRLLDALELIDASDTRWVRAFVDVRRKLARGGDPADDPDVLALRRAARERDCELIVSLKWDFRANWGDKEPVRVPPPGSQFERELFACARRHLEAIGAPVAVVVLGNEPMWETLAADVRVDDPPIVRFTRRAKDALLGLDGLGDPSYLVGAFNRSHDADVRERQYPQFLHGMFDLAREDEDVAGIDLHVHYDGIGQAERTLAVARSELPDSTIAVTEFSPVWRYHRHVHTPIASFEGGEAFVADHDLSNGMTVVEYFEDAKRNPRSPEEVGEFYEAMPWYNVDHVADVYALFDEYDVGVGTMGFLQGLGMRNEDWTDGWLPFHINFLFQPALMRTEGGIERTAHPHYLDDYRERSGGGEPGAR